jgi:primosomal protein N' (replication factor Y)
MLNTAANPSVVLAQVLLPIPVDYPFSYFALPDQQIGDVVLVECGSRKLYGVVVALLSNQQANDKTKTVISTSSEIKLNNKHLEFINQLASYNIASTGLVLKSFLANSNAKNKTSKQLNKLEQNISNLALKNLTCEQEQIFNSISKQLASCHTFLLHGATGSGKTEIFFHLIYQVLQSGKQVLILLPEIALTSQLINRFQQQFGFMPAVWHSKIKPSSKKSILLAINDGSAKVVIGARSALLLPFANLGLIVIDEEHDASFKQEDVFNFHARDMAILQGKIYNVPVLLCSATPSLESIYNAKINKYQYFRLKSKLGSGNSLHFIDLTQEKAAKKQAIMPVLQQAIVANLANKQQTLLFLNRKGYAPVTICQDCGYKYDCKNCDFHLVLYKQKQQLICNHCGFWQKVPQQCNKCGSQNPAISLGFAIEKLIEEVQNTFPTAKIAVASSDTLKNFQDAQNLVDKISNMEVDIIIGTQIIAKGYDFANLSLIGIVDADSLLYSSDLRASERGFQLLTQLIGRAGRRQQQGKIIIQTYNPKNLLFSHLKDDDNFYDFELNNRQLLQLPPFSHMARIEISAKISKDALDFAKMLLTALPIDDKLIVYGPAPAPIARLKNRYHFLLHLSINKKFNLAKLINDVLASIKVNSKIRVRVHINPF